MIDNTFVTPTALTTFVREVPSEANWTLNSVLPDVQVKSIEAVFNQVTKRNRAATFRAYDAETPIGKRDSFSRKAVTLPPLGQKTVIGELERLQLEAIRAGGDNSSAIQDAIYDDAELNARATLARMEIARGDVLNDGKLTLAGENKMVFEADFGLAANHIVTPTTLWGAAGATPIADLQAWGYQYLLDNGTYPGRLLMSTTVLQAALKSDEVRTAVYGQNAAGISAVSIAQLNTVLAGYGLPPISTYDAVIEDATGTNVNPLDPKKVALLPSVENAAQLGRTYWGITAEALELAGGENPSLEYDELPGLVCVVMKEGDPVRRWTKVGAVGMPVIEDPRKLIVATVLS